MANVPFDTLKLARRLRDDAKLPAEQAGGIAEALADTLEAQMATKADLEGLEQRLTIKIGAMLVALAGFLAAIRFFG